ncbi:MAG TPA: MFS transporter, partial [Acidobacteriota bacterium]|nr:MFS transporter [Acidobacteriota bacterium]
MNPWKGLQGLPREIWILFAATLTNRAGTMVLPFLVLYLTDSLGFSAGHAGFILAVYGIGALISAPLSGWLCDRYGGYRIMRESLLLTGLVLILIPLFKTFAAVTVAVFLLALANEMFRPANLAYMSLLVMPEQRKPAFSLIRLSINLGMSVGPALGGFLAGVSFLWLFVIDALTSLAAGLLLAFSNFREIKGEHLSQHKKADGSAPPAASPLRDRRFIAYVIAILPVAFVFFQHISAMPLFMVRNLHLQEHVYGLMFTINTLLIVFLEVPLNLATAHWPYRLTLVLGCILCAAGFGGLALATGLYGVIATVVVWTFGEMVLFPGSSAYVAHIATPARQGQYMGMYTMAWGVSFSLGPWLGVYILDHF